MLAPTLDDVISPEGHAAWDALIASLPADGLYHGTSLDRAERIMVEGFRTSFGRVVEDDRVDTYWGRVAVAANFAYRNATIQGCRPAILAARIEDVLASGSPMALRTACDDIDVEYSSWRECHAATGSFWVRGGRHVAGLVMHTIPLPHS